MAYMDSSVQVLAAMLVLAGCLYATAKCLQQLLRYYRVKRFGHATHARIIDYKESGSGDHFCYLAIVQFTTPDGENIVATAKDGNYIKPVVNAEVLITYDSRHPHCFYFTNHFSAFFYLLMPLLFLGGTLLSVFFLLQLFRGFL